jgi:hypothetical protein
MRWASRTARRNASRLVGQPETTIRWSTMAKLIIQSYMERLASAGLHSNFSKRFGFLDVTPVPIELTQENRDYICIEDHRESSEASHPMDTHRMHPSFQCQAGFPLLALPGGGVYDAQLWTRF